MKASKNFKLVNVGNDYILVPLGESIDSFNGTVVLNEVSAYIFELLSDEMDFDSIVNSIVKEFDVTIEVARKDVANTIEQMITIGVIYE